MTVLEALKQLRDDLKLWVTNNLKALDSKIEEKTIPIDAKLDENSTNPVQNKVIAEALKNASGFSGKYEDLVDAPNIAEDDSGDMYIADADGNIIFKVSSDGAHTTALSLNGQAAATEAYVDEAISSIESPEVDLTNIYTKEQTDSAIDEAMAALSENIESEDSEWKVIDSEGNIIFIIDATGVHSTALELNGEPIQDTINEIASSKAPKTLRVKMDSAGNTNYSSDEIIAHIQDGGYTILEDSAGGEVTFLHMLDGAVYYGTVSSDEGEAKIVNIEVKNK